MQRFLFMGALSGFLAVAFGAFAAHGLSDKLSPHMLAVFKTGAEYQLSQALILVVVSLLSTKYHQSKALKISAWAFVFGLLVFPFSLYALALTGITWLGAITPLGGLGFLVGWAFLAVFAFQQYQS